MGRLFQIISSLPELERAWKAVRKKGGKSPGIDNNRLEDFAAALRNNLLGLSRSLREDAYRPAPLVAVFIPKANSEERRLIAIPTVRDRVAQHSAVEALHYLLEPLFLPSSFAFRQGTGVGEALSSVRGLLQRGRFWAFRGDIKGCFDELSWDKLSAALKLHIPDEALRRFLNRSFRVPYIFGDDLLRRRRGVPQGSPLSPILANLYLHPFDEALRKHRLPLVRYADDWLVLCADVGEAEKAASIAHAELTFLGVGLNERKSRIFDLRKETVDFLGFRVGKGKIDGDPAALERMHRCARALRSEDQTARRRARSELKGIQAAYGNAGPLRFRSDPFSG